MADQTNFQKLLQQVELLQEKQNLLQQEMHALKEQLLAMGPGAETPDLNQTTPARAADLPVNAPLPSAPPVVHHWRRKEETAPPSVPSKKPLPSYNFQQNLERFIGENLINKIGIAILVIGVGIGAKYAIDHELISPLTRIVLGYLAGMGLMGFAIHLKPKYHDFSAVLLSGSMAIMYFITFAAYEYYALFPQVPAFGLMLLFTGFTVVAALQYNRQVIAHIGLVGAYAVPFLLSDGSGRVHILFTYMTIINIGILVIAFKRYWKPLYYAAFGMSWLVYLGWYAAMFRHQQHFSLAFVFAAVFFLTFYLTFLAYKLLRKEVLGNTDGLLLLLNSFIFYGMGYALLDEYPGAAQYLGLFTLLNALVHFIVCSTIYKRQLADKRLFFMLAGLVLVFITLAIPVQLDGNWVSLLWAGETALLFWVGRSRQVPLYEKLSFPLMLLAFGSLLHDWSNYYSSSLFWNSTQAFRLLLNPYFLTSLLFVGAFSFMAWLNFRSQTSLKANSPLAKGIPYGIGTILLLVLYFAFYLEISTYWMKLFEASQMEAAAPDGSQTYWINNSSLLQYQTVWVINYSLLFISLLILFNQYKLKIGLLGWLALGLGLFSLLVFFSSGLQALNSLRLAWLQPEFMDYYPQGRENLLVRYASFVLVALLLWSAYLFCKPRFHMPKLRISYDLVLAGVVLWLASNELIHWMQLSGSGQSHKLGLSILWGIFALVAVGWGIRKKKKHLRMGAFLLFGMTLLKLFLYDLGHLDTIAKTIVLVSLGILLLIISFLYNKYKHLIADANQP